MLLYFELAFVDICENCRIASRGKKSGEALCVILSNCLCCVKLSLLFLLNRYLSIFPNLRYFFLFPVDFLLNPLF